MSDPKVKLYTVSTCPHCRAARRLLDDCKVNYECTDLDTLDDEARDAAVENICRLNPACSLPTIVIGNTVIVGFRENLLREALGLK